MATIYERIGLAMVFSETLHEALTAEQITIVVARNLADGPASSVCHSHNFCDANMVLLDAWEAFFGGEPDFDSDADLTTITEAWAIAKAAHFWAKGACQG